MYDAWMPPPTNLSNTNNMLSSWFVLSFPFRSVSVCLRSPPPPEEETVLHALSRRLSPHNCHRSWAVAPAACCVVSQNNVRIMRAHVTYTPRYRLSRFLRLTSMTSIRPLAPARACAHQRLVCEQEEGLVVRMPSTTLAASREIKRPRLSTKPVIAFVSSAGERWNPIAQRARNSFCSVAEQRQASHHWLVATLHCWPQHRQDGGQYKM